MKALCCGVQNESNSEGVFFLDLAGVTGVWAPVPTNAHVPTAKSHLKRVNHSTCVAERRRLPSLLGLELRP